MVISDIPTNIYSLFAFVLLFGITYINSADDRSQHLR